MIDMYPNFLAGYYQRAEARRKIGDRKGAEMDEFKVMKAQLDKQNGVSNSDKTVVDNKKVIRKRRLKLVKSPIRI